MVFGASGTLSRLPWIRERGTRWPANGR